MQKNNDILLFTKYFLDFFTYCLVYTLVRQFLIAQRTSKELCKRPSIPFNHSSRNKIRNRNKAYSCGIKDYFYIHTSRYNFAGKKLKYFQIIITIIISCSTQIKQERPHLQYEVFQGSSHLMTNRVWCTSNWVIICSMQTKAVEGLGAI